MTPCDLRNDCQAPALYRAWLAGPHPDGPCDGHPVCPRCACDLRVGRRPHALIKLADL
jgi:hypothetical protein